VDLLAASHAMVAAAALAPSDPVAADLAQELEKYAADLYNPSS
jgi:hypothetical protein